VRPQVPSPALEKKKGKEGKGKKRKFKKERK
jgi:hypothetical protein